MNQSFIDYLKSQRKWSTEGKLPDQGCMGSCGGAKIKCRETFAPCFKHRTLSNAAAFLCSTSELSFMWPECI